MITIKVSPDSYKAIAGLKKKVRQVVVATNMDLWNDCVEGTPRDTGAASAYWWPALEGTPPAHPSPPARTNMTPAGFFPPAPFPAEALMASAGRRLTIANGAAYINRLEYEGHSSQAPDGWVRKAVARYPVNFRAHVLKASGGKA